MLSENFDEQVRAVSIYLVTPLALKTKTTNINMDSNPEAAYPTRIEQVFILLRESFLNKPPYISGSLRLPASCFSLFYRTTKDGHNARFETKHRRESLTDFMLIDISFDDLEQLAQSREPTSLAMQ